MILSKINMNDALSIECSNRSLQFFEIKRERERERIANNSNNQSVINLIRNLDIYKNPVNFYEASLSKSSKG